MGVPIMQRAPIKLRARGISFPTRRVCTPPATSHSFSPTPPAQLAPSCLRYMGHLRHPEVFRFCAIPQVMAIATLAKVVNNADVFTGVVKIRKGQVRRGEREWAHALSPAAGGMFRC